MGHGDTSSLAIQTISLSIALFEFLQHTVNNRSLYLGGQLVDPTSLLNDLRTNIGSDTSSGFPGPNSGLSVQL